jgi:SAM-dependent methyltransferase
VGFVDYERTAGSYQEGRSAIARPADWHKLVAPYLIGREYLRVLDLGAGTGIFAKVWPSWGASNVIALDPSPAMLGQAQQAALPPEVQLVVGHGEMIPLRSDTIGLAWLSAVVHHLADQTICARELRRVLVPDGRVLIRGFFAGTSQLGWLALFPGAHRATARFPSVADIEETFGAAGFSMVALKESPEPDTPASVVRSWCTRMRDVDTLLTAFTDDEFTAGLAALDDLGSDTLSGCLHLVVLQ